MFQLLFLKRHIDFLNPNFTTLLHGKLENIHPSAANNWLIQEAQWFQVDGTLAISSLKTMYKHYKKHIPLAKKQKFYATQNYSWDKMKELVDSILDKNLPKFSQQVELNMPKLNLPKLKKVK